jgi:hypothetical protein
MLEESTPGLAQYVQQRRSAWRMAVIAFVACITQIALMVIVGQVEDAPGKSDPIACPGASDFTDED